MRSVRSMLAAFATACCLVSLHAVAAPPDTPLDLTPRVHGENDDAVLASPAWSEFLAQLRENALRHVDEPRLRLACRAGLIVDVPAIITPLDACLMSALVFFDRAADYETAAVAAERRQNAAHTASPPHHFGIGLLLSPKDLWHVLFVFGTERGSPAERAGILRGDVIARIDGAEVAPLTSAQIVEALRGEDGTTVRLDILRGPAHEPLTFTMRRAPFEHSTVMRERGTARVASLSFEDLDARTPDDLARRVDEILRASPIAPSGLIVDLRGLRVVPLEPAVQLAGAFAPDGSIVGYVLTSHGEIALRATSLAAFSAAARDWLGRVRIAVLVDWSTQRGAAELALFLREQRGARIFGEHAAGGADVFTTIPLGGDTSMRIRTGLLRSTTHADWDLSGIEPDERFRPPSQHGHDTPDDVVYQAALDYLDRP